ncbi:fungal-specific transcription factor domain-containing protein [Microdochium trichocladiopsis]|uniref:Fungal-specific transcription factor domain-containing protein n=1 Tax=Microdochium trichocladiopsis TaxID=1682393 RepID=A0A9P8Y650_9PEZI|nr:fungal-specific transcription factor domain-containing protein [Microdochium trichocladiopsis]KAH7028851.1 fungal-specific transcription factor domain-containing protein [Microdochium trichocladiopsis]
MAFEMTLDLSRPVQLSSFQQPPPLGHTQQGGPGGGPSAPLPPAKRHCWECLRRRLVCDAGQPYCRKCHDAGVVCPGYDDKKPLKWIATGTISSRPRHKKLTALADGGKAGGKPASRAPARKKKQEQRQSVTATAPTADGLKSSPQQQDGCLPVLPHVDLRSTTCDVVQAAYYYNTWVLPSYDSALELAPNPFIAKFPMEILPYLTDGLRHTVVALAIGHRIHQLPLDASRGDSVDLWSRLFHHRCLAIRELSHDIASEDKRSSDSTIVTIILFLFVELQQMPATNWRQHLDGLTQLIELRGGPRQFLKNLPSLSIGLSSFFMVGVMANTTCPPLCDNSAVSHYELIDLLATMYGEGSYPTCLCPPALFVTIVEINYLRAQQALANFMAPPPPASRSITPQSQPPLLWSEENGSMMELPLWSTPEHQGNSSSDGYDFAQKRQQRQDMVSDVMMDATLAMDLPLLPETTTTNTNTTTTFSRSNSNSDSSTNSDSTNTQEYWLDPALARHDVDAHARALLKDILAYSPEDSAAPPPPPQQPRSFPEDRLVLGRLWQSALVIYLIASLQSLGALRSPFLRGQLAGLRAIHGARLYEQLRLAVESPRLKKSVLWPLVVCGFDAASTVDSSRGGSGNAPSAEVAATAEERRRFVEARLPILGQDVGTSLPEYARMVLRKFWDSGRTDWDSCFDKAYAFVT